MKWEDERKSEREERITSRSERRRKGERWFLAMRVLEIPAVGEGGWKRRGG